MYCPLCKAEYRQGVSICTDCHIALVFSREDADAVSVATAWEGSDRRELDRVLAALDSAQIPSHCKESIERRASSWISMFFAMVPLLSPIVKRRPLVHFSVSVLETDLTQTKSALCQIEENARREYEK